MSYIKVFPLESERHEPSTGSSYIIVNKACDCAAMIIASSLNERQAQRLIAKTTELKVNVDWILLSEKPFFPDAVRMLQAECGGIIAGAKAALAQFENNKFYSSCQFEQLTEHQVILLGHIELLVLAAKSQNKSCFLIENNLFGCDQYQLALTSEYSIGADNQMIRRFN